MGNRYLFPIGSFLFTAQLWICSPIAFAVQTDELELMHYNLDSLYDAKHDQGKDDWMYLPKETPHREARLREMYSGRYLESALYLDWNDAIVEARIRNLARAIKLTKPNGLPDLLAVTEIENRALAEKLARAVGYEKLAITQAKPSRQLNVALFYKQSEQFEFKSSREVVLPQLADGTSSGCLLEVYFEFQQLALRVFVVDWPSPGKPVESRIMAARTLMQTLKATKQHNPEAHTIVVGSFNSPPEDWPDPIRSILTEKSNGHPLQDVHKLFNREGSIRQKKMMPLGTYFYVPSMEWLRYERFFVGQELTDGVGLEVESASYRILAPKEISEDRSYQHNGYHSYGSVVTGTPRRPNLFSVEDTGYSDRFPIFVRLKAKSKTR